MKLPDKRRFSLILMVAVGLATFPARAETIDLTARLSGANEVPPNDSTSSGMGSASFDTETLELKWNITHEGMSGPLIGAHIHGPAPASGNAGILVPLDADDNPIEGSAVLNDEQAGHLLDGNSYINLHTEKYPSGELRGQLTR